MKKKGLILCSLLLSFTLGAQITLIPDAAFEQFLIDEGIDTDGVLNGQVLTADIADVTILNFQEITTIQDLTGIEDFASLEALQIFRMPLNTINLSQNLILNELNLDDVSLTSLDISSNLNLTKLNLNLNSISGSFPSTISEINLSSNTLLERINIGNTFEEIDLSNAPNLTFVDLVFSPALKYLNLNNGNNVNLDFVQLENNPSLECWQVDDPDAVMAGVTPPYDSWVINNNPLMIITDDCDLGIQDYLQSQIKLYPNPVANKLYIQTSDRVDVEAIRIYDLMGKRMLQTKANSELDVSHLSKGIYLVSITTNKGTLTQKLIKE